MSLPGKALGRTSAFCAGTVTPKYLVWNKVAEAKSVLAAIKAAKEKFFHSSSKNNHPGSYALEF